MDIFSDTGYLIIMDPHYLELGNKEKFESLDFLTKPKQAAVDLENEFFPDSVNGKIGLIVLPDGPGKYEFDVNHISYWDVDDKNKKTKSIFGVELGSYIICDITHIQSLVLKFDKFEMAKKGEQLYFQEMNKKLSKDGKAIIWNLSHVGIGDGWHQINWDAFTKQA